MTTRERLVAAAIDFLEQGGEAAVRVDEVAAAAGVKRPSIYHYFGDREGLIIAAQAERYSRTLLEGIEEQTKAVILCKTRGDFFSLLRSWINNNSDKSGVRRRRIRVEVLGASTTRPELRSLLAEREKAAMKRIAAVLAMAQDKGWIDYRLDFETSAIWWIGVMNGRYLVEGDGASGEGVEWDRITAEALIRLLGPPAIEKQENGGPGGPP